MITTTQDAAKKEKNKANSGGRLVAVCCFHSHCLLMLQIHIFNWNELFFIIINALIFGIYLKDHCNRLLLLCMKCATNKIYYYCIINILK